MAVGKIEISVESVGLRELQTALGRIFKPEDNARILKDALEKAILPAFQALKQTTPIGPTGNLNRAIAKKVVAYPRDGNAVALVGFRRAGRGQAESAAGGQTRAGPDRAFHQYWLEEGTRDRVTRTQSQPKSYNRTGYNKPGFERGSFQMTRKGKTFRVTGHSVRSHAVAGHIVRDPNSYYYASSYNELGRFKIERFRLGEKGFVTSPAYPNAFFRKSRNPITIPAMRPGGTSGQPPLEAAWNRSQSLMAEILQRELQVSLSRALDSLSRSSFGTIDS